MLNRINLRYLPVILGLLIHNSVAVAVAVESDVPVLESEEALAKSEAARQESADAQRELEQERVNSAPVIASAKQAIAQAERDEKRALNDRLATERFVAAMKKQKAELSAKKQQFEGKAKKAQQSLRVVEHQREGLQKANALLVDGNRELSDRINNLSLKERQLMAEIKTLKIRQAQQRQARKALQQKLSRSRNQVKALQVSRASYR